MLLLINYYIKGSSKIDLHFGEPLFFGDMINYVILINKLKTMLHIGIHFLFIYMLANKINEKRGSLKWTKWY